MSSSYPLPKARRDGLVIRGLADEVLVYDLTRHKAHSLNRMAAAVWRCCDGQTTVAAMASKLQQDLATPVDREMVWSALAQLGRARLLTGEIRSEGNEAGLSRRELMRLLGAAAVTVPLVTTIAAPARAQAVSCLAQFDPCDPNTGPPCCPGLTCTLDQQSGLILCSPSG